MTRVRRFALPLMVITVMGAMPPSLFAQRAFEGVYIASGVDSAGNEYQRAVEIERHGERFIVWWVSARVIGEALVLEPIWVGVGIVTDETLSVGFVADYAMGIMVYRFGPSGQLSGRWTLEGDDEEICSETLTPLPDVLPVPAAVDPPQEQQPRPSPAPAIGAFSL
jgi:hypothetical protein